jgi:hypothetical protein
MRLAMLAPITWPVRPALPGRAELIARPLTEGLVARGVDTPP